MALRTERTRAARSGNGRRQPPSPVRKRGGVAVTQPSLTQQAYDAVKMSIITMDYRPGACIVEAQMSERHQFGRTPVHEAVSRLAHERMLDILPRKGIVIRPLSLDDALANIEARLIIEPACARLAAERATAEDLDEIATILDRAKPMVSRRDIKGLMLVDRAYHNAIARAARNPTLEAILERLHERSLRFWFVSLSDTKHLMQVDDEHRGVLRALQKNDAAAVERAVREHIESFRETIKQSI
jgi:DNA-binding GntR family transcriptional regulator